MKVFNIVFSILLSLISAFLIYLLNDLGFLSNKILIVLVLLLLLMALGIIIIIFKAKKTVFKVLSYIIGFVIVIVCSIGIYYLNTTLGFIDNFGKADENYDNYYVVALKSSNYKNLNDLKDKTIANCEDLSKDVLNKINVKYKSKKYESKEAMVKDLYDKKVDSIIISDVSEYLIDDADDNFERRIKVIYTISIPKKNAVKPSKVDITKEPFTFFISGIDTSGAISKVSRSDVNIVVTVNPNSHEILLTAIPRDYYVRLHGTTGLKDKLTHAGLYGIDMSVNTIQDLLDINLDYYARINFDTVVNLVNLIGGIDVYSDQNLSFCNIKKGNNHLNGACALRFSRERKSYKTGDRHRGENQEVVIEAIINKVQKSPAILTKYSNILNNLKNNFETNVSADVMKEFIKLQIGEMPSWNVKTLNLNGSNSENYTYTYDKSLWLYVMEPDYSTVDRANIVIKEMLSGKTFKELNI